jgi:hypothetical protein
VQANRAIEKPSFLGAEQSKICGATQLSSEAKKRKRKGREE